MSVTRLMNVWKFWEGKEMAGTTFFHNKHGGVSSSRISINGGSSKNSMTTYSSGTRGGVTFKSGNLTSRINGEGRAIGGGLKCGNDTTYFGSDYRVRSEMPAFR